MNFETDTIGLTDSEEAEVQNIIQLAEKALFEEDSQIKEIISSADGKEKLPCLEEGRKKESLYFNDEVLNVKEWEVRDEEVWDSFEDPSEECMEEDADLEDEDSSEECMEEDADLEADHHHHYNTGKKNCENKADRPIFNTRHSRQFLPMNNIKGPYFIEKGLVTMYQEGLMFKKWNPTQVVYEICSQCQWLPPNFVQHAYSRSHGFLFSVSINGRKFFGRKRGQTKKYAQHQASTAFLNFLGFKFEQKESELSWRHLSERKRHESTDEIKLKSLRNETRGEVRDLREKIKMRKNLNESRGSSIDSTRNEPLNWLRNRICVHDSRVIPTSSTRNEHLDRLPSPNSDHDSKRNTCNLKMRPESVSSEISLKRIGSYLYVESKDKKKLKRLG